MVLTRPGSGRVDPLDVDVPAPGAGQVLVRVLACGVCRTDLHIVDGELRDAKVPLIPGHEIVGTVERTGPQVVSLQPGTRVGIPWLGSTCAACEFCRAGRENLCRQGRYTGYQLDGGYAEYAVASAAWCFPLPDAYDAAHAAPFLCAGAIGYRAYRMGGDGRRVGLYGFGAAAHLVAQLARYEGRDVYAFVTPGDEDARRFALDVGVTWAGWSNAAPPVALDCALLFAPVGALVPEALSRVAPGGVVVCAGIHMSDIPAFAYRLLWEERSIRSVANVTRADVGGFLSFAAQAPLLTHVRTYPLARANEALGDLRAGRLTGVAVLTVADE
jgi:propanol-preferring alcohol dehydrogenase